MWGLLNYFVSAPEYFRVYWIINHMGGTRACDYLKLRLLHEIENESNSIFSVSGEYTTLHS